MLSSLAILIVLFASGVIMAIYLPLALAYIVSIIRKTHFGMQMIWKVMLRLVTVLFVYIMLVGFLGLILDGLNLLDQGTPEEDMALGFGFMIGFVVGIILFLIGILKGRVQAASSKSSWDSLDK